MFRKALLSIALLAVMLTTFAPVHAEGPTPTPGRTLNGQIVSLSAIQPRYLTLMILPTMRPVRVYVTKDTQICLRDQLIDFNQLLPGDTVIITLQLNINRSYVAQLIEVSRKGLDAQPTANIMPPTCGLKN